MRVLLADDDARVRSDVRRVLTADGRFAVCAEATEEPWSTRALTWDLQWALPTRLGNARA